MKYLITGGAGFIGFNLAEKLLKIKKNKIILIDDFSKKINHNHLKPILKNKNVKLIKGDLNKILRFLKVYDFDYIFHFAAILGVKKVIDYPFDTLKNNISTTISLIEFAKKQKNLKKLCFTSTSEVYAYSLEKKLIKYPTPENVDFVIPKTYNSRSSYLLSKIVGEYLINYSKINYVIFRPHNIFGPQMGFKHVIPQITEKLIKQKKYITINNSNHKRTFCYIDFAIELMLKISHSKFSSKNIFNIGSPDKEISIINLAKKIKNILKSKTNLKQSRFKKYNSPTRRKPDMRKSLIYATSKHNFERGLKNTVLWYMDYFKIT